MEASWGSPQGPGSIPTANAASHAIRAQHTHAHTPDTHASALYRTHTRHPSCGEQQPNTHVARYRNVRTSWPLLGPML